MSNHEFGMKRSRNPFIPGERAGEYSGRSNSATQAARRANIEDELGFSQPKRPRIKPTIHEELSHLREKVARMELEIRAQNSSRLLVGSLIGGMLR